MGRMEAHFNDEKRTQTRWKQMEDARNNGDFKAEQIIISIKKM